MAIRHKRTTTTGYTWQAGDTVEGQIGLNLTDGTLHFKKANGVYVNISEGSGSGITDVVQDTTPQLGGNLDVNGNSIVSASNGDIAITPNGTGAVIIDGNEFPQTQGAKDDILVADGGGLLEWKKPEKLMAYVYNADSVQINKGEPVYVFSAQGDQISVKRALNTGDATSAQTLGLANENIAATASGYVVCQGPLTNVDTSAYTAGQALYLGATAGSVTTTKPSEPNHLVYLGFVEKVNASSGRIYVRTQNGYELAEIHDVNINNATALADNHYLRYNSANTRWENAALDIVNDTTPQLGGNLDVNGNSIVSTSNGNITLAPNGTGKVVISGDLQIDGTTTTVNSTTLDVDDINITIAKGAANAAAANGGGITLEGPTTAATITYASADDSWNLNKKTSVTELQVDNININGSTISSTNTDGSITIAPNGAGDVIITTDTVNINENTVTIKSGASDASILTLMAPGTSATASEINILTGDNNTTYSQIELLSGDNGTSGLRVLGQSIGTTSLTGQLSLNGYLGSDATTGGGNILIPAAADQPITITPNGTGDVRLNADTIRVGDNNTDATITTFGTGDLILNTNGGSASGSITIADGANGQITIAPNGTGIVSVQGLHVGVITSTAGSSPITARHTAIASSSIANYSLNVQKHRTDIALASMTSEPAVIGFSVRDNTNTNRFFGRIIANYQGTGTNPNFQFSNSTDGFTTNNVIATIGNGTGVWGQANAGYTHTTNGNGNLTLNTNSGTNSGSIVINQGANQNISITPNGTGYVTLDGVNWPNTAGTNNFVLSTNGSNQASWTNPQSLVFTYSATNSTTLTLTSTSNYIQHIYGGTGTTVTLPSTATMTIGQGFRFINNSGQTATINTSTSALVASLPSGQSLYVYTVNTASNAATSWIAARDFEAITGIGSAVLATSPTISSPTLTGTIVAGTLNTNATITTNGTGDLILNTNSGTNSGNITINDGGGGYISITPEGTGRTVIKNLNYYENVYAYGNSGALTWAPDVAGTTASNIVTMTLTGNLTFNGFTNPISGQTLTVVLTQDGTGGRTLTSTMKFAGGSKTLSTAANAIDILTVSYIGTTYYATLSKGYV